MAANDSGASAAATQRRFIEPLPSPTRTPILTANVSA
jgi:hypothetical protein